VKTGLNQRGIALAIQPNLPPFDVARSSVMMKRIEGPVAISKAEPATATGVIVLFVSPDADLRAVATRVLAREGYVVLTAAHAGHALLAGLMLDRIDILISEMAFDDIAGPALADRLRRNHAGLRSLFMGDIGTPPADGLLVRPFTRDDLLVELRALSSSATSQQTS
jgi:DNA-binding response OmpR family regulator